MACYLHLKNDADHHILNHLDELKSFLKDNFDLDCKIIESEFNGQVVYNTVFFNENNSKLIICYDFDEEENRGNLYINPIEGDMVDCLVIIKEKFNDDSYLIDSDGFLYSDEIDSEHKEFKRTIWMEIKDYIFNQHPIGYVMMATLLILSYCIKNF